MTNELTKPTETLLTPCQVQQQFDAAAATERRGPEEEEYCTFGCHRKVYRGGWCIRCWEEEHN